MLNCCIISGKKESILQTDSLLQCTKHIFFYYIHKGHIQGFFIEIRQVLRTTFKKVVVGHHQVELWIDDRRGNHQRPCSPRRPSLAY